MFDQDLVPSHVASDDLNSPKGQGGMKGSQGDNDV